MEYREYRPGDQQQLNDLYNEVFSRRRTIEQWKWMYRDAPAGPAKIVVIDDEGEIIAHEAMIPLHFHVLGEEVLGGKLEDAYISATHRGKGLFGPLENFCLQTGVDAGYRFTFGLTAIEAAYRIHIKKGYRHIGSLNACFAPLRPEGATAEIARVLQLSSPKRVAMGIALRILGKRFERKAATIPDKPDAYRIERVERFDGSFDELWREFAGNRQVVSVTRSSAFLNWRYADNPYREYTVFAAKTGDRVAAYICAAAVTREDMDLRLKVGVVADFLALPGHEAAYSSLARRAVEAWRSFGADVAIVWARRDAEYSRDLVGGFRRLGFVSTHGRYDIPFLVKTFDPVLENDTFLDIHSWHLTHAFGAAWV